MFPLAGTNTQITRWDPRALPPEHLRRTPSLVVGRRAIIRGGVAGGIVVTTLPLACGGHTGVPDGPIAAGNVSAVPVDSLRIVSGENVVLGRDAGGLYAMSAVCTHAGCVVAVAPLPTGGVNCPCHGSAYDRYGSVTRGPAGRSLQHYRVDVASDGSITIQGGVQVVSTDRTPVP